MAEKIIGIKAMENFSVDENAYRLIGLRADGVKCFYRIEDVEKKNGKLIIEIDVEGSMYEANSDDIADKDSAYLYLMPHKSNQIAMNIIEPEFNVFEVGNIAGATTWQLIFGVTGKIGDTTGPNGDKIGDRTGSGKIGDTTGPTGP